MNKASLLLSWFFMNLSFVAFPSVGSWGSKVTGGNIVFTATDSPNPAKDVSGNYMTVVYLENLGFEKLGGNSHTEDVAWLLDQGYRVIELDYENHPNAVSPKINEDIIAINKVLASGTFGGMSHCSSYRSYVLFEGYRIKRDVSYFKDDPTVYNKPDSYVDGDSLHMDIIYPANAEEAVPIVLSFSYSNSSAMSAESRDQRTFLPYTFAGFNDSVLEGAPARGIAWAIADHPKYCPWGGGKPVGGPNDAYKSYQANPDAAQKVKSAVRTLRALGDDLGLSGKIGIYGFSRGSDAGSMAVGDRVVPSLENTGLYTEYSDDVQAAALGAGVFDFTQIYNSLNDGDSNLETRCPWVWGNLEDNYVLWESMGAAHLAETSSSAPVLFWYNTSDSPYYLDQIVRFKSRLDSLGVPTATLTDYGNGHAVPQNAGDLEVLYTFFDEYLKPPALDLVKKDSTTMTVLGHPFNSYSLPFTISPNPVKDTLRLTFNLKIAGLVKFAFCDLSGSEISSRENHFRIGEQIEIIDLNAFKLSNGVYYILVITNDKRGIKKFIKE
ncbi:MAG: T9SS type A sorting domain-containing protein [Cyclobacteriaceae bacterium]